MLKKCRAAAWLRADQLLFATTAKEWKSATRTLVEKEISNFRGWGPIGPPLVRFLTNLGGSEIRED